MTIYANIDSKCNKNLYKKITAYLIHGKGLQDQMNDERAKDKN